MSNHARNLGIAATIAGVGGLLFKAGQVGVAIVAGNTPAAISHGVELGVSTLGTVAANLTCVPDSVRAGFVTLDAVVKGINAYINAEAAAGLQFSGATAHQLIEASLQIAGTVADGAAAALRTAQTGRAYEQTKSEYNVLREPAPRPAF
ncbi:MAG: hypothetical protein K0S08_534 [Gammaproteobacteria bacterium]|jgi:hypothetical protein|nr:hypothetical protein [Gammaproteobacteria bacterium]